MIGTIVRTSLLLMFSCGLLYPLVVTGIAKVTMPHQANGSLLYNEEKEVIGSELIGQQFTTPGFFHSRVSSIEYDAAGSGSNNYAPSNTEMISRTKELIIDWKKANPDVPIDQLPIDLITNSGSGLDPHISPEAAIAQIPRIVSATGLSNDDLNKLVDKHTENKELGMFGEDRVNVLKLNLDLAKLIQ
ncbi:potassium-transporting ATPase subunit KdpC [Metabacillus sediminilitoris]|uniref:Potassium-transporting ATPase KdpC subunit n=1 Tax=Metabacillus sediminilitoris TaxID=2567941 RepID=A0A4S4BUV8_9BACI|nr:potassium-transporting ATPase subunit KdpC [Metabacillus sediminilitoris]QGQ44766.1 potassium-transporting ATPase subunit KdpC [Metabacillus sediminilitoris]THF78886.1 potassium-transporting ATPase subunit KdpC [Metabacillus sediminilitoris]